MTFISRKRPFTCPREIAGQKGAVTGGGGGGGG